MSFGTQYRQNSTISSTLAVNPVEIAVAAVMPFLWITWYVLDPLYKANPTVFLIVALTVVNGLVTSVT